MLSTGVTTFVFLLVEHYGVRKLEALIVLLVAVVSVCFLVEPYMADQDASKIAMGFLVEDGRSLYLALSIVGALIAPHNLFLQSAVVLSRSPVPPHW